jgi:hypothetical protein
MREQGGASRRTPRWHASHRLVVSTCDRVRRELEPSAVFYLYPEGSRPFERTEAKARAEPLLALRERLAISFIPVAGDRRRKSVCSNPLAYAAPHRRGAALRGARSSGHTATRGMR